MAMKLEKLDICRQDGQISYSWSSEKPLPPLVPDKTVIPGDVVRVNRGDIERIDITVHEVNGSEISGEITSIANPSPARETLDKISRGTIVRIDANEIFHVTRHVG